MPEKNRSGPTSFDPAELDLPVAYSAEDGTRLTISQYLKGEKIIPDAEMSAEQWESLISAYVQAAPDFKIVSIDAGLIDRDRALREIRANSRVGQTLQELFRLVIENLRQKADRLRQMMEMDTSR